MVIFFSTAMNVISPNEATEYRYLNKNVGNMFSTLRMALGDMDFTVLEKKEDKGAY